MASNLQPAQQTDGPEIHLVGLSVYLSNPGITPSLVNPDFLRHNGIVDPTWTVMQPVTMDQGNSRVRYSNGLSFFASNDHVFFSQHPVVDEERATVAALTLEDVVCASAASKYVGSVAPRSPYDFMSIDPTGWIQIDSRQFTELSSPLKDLAARIPVAQEIPEVQVRAQYTVSGKIATIYVSEVVPANDDSVVRLLFSGEIMYDLEEYDSNRTSAETVTDILGKWQEDVGLFRELVYRFYATYIREE